MLSQLQKHQCPRASRSVSPVLPHCHRLVARRCPIARASPENELPGVMTSEKAFAVLGLPPSSTFEEVVQAKNRLLNRDLSQDRLLEIETAYDMLFMQNMKKRLTGELEVSTSVRYADVPSAPKKSGGRAGAVSPSPTLRPTLPKLPNAPSISLQAPRNTSIAGTQAAVFGGLAVWALVQALLETPEQQLAETAGFPLALALAYGIYTLKENKNMQLGKAAGVTLGCLLAGAMVGNLVEAWLRVDIVPVLGFSSPGTLVAEFIIAACAAGAIFLV